MSFSQSLEAVLLTGGASSRMGRDKAQIEVGGTGLAERTAREFASAGIPVTILGNEELEGFPFQADPEAFQGPLFALSRFEPEADMVFVASCDMPFFSCALVEVLAARLGEADAAVPNLGGRPQPTCALYRARAVRRARAVWDSRKRSLMAWLKALETVPVDEEDLRRAGLDPRDFRGVNTPEELAAELGRRGL
jgi:molybdopterin-guanine dinucleotide biosynthesis protein A